jgi:hypothetical protein
MPHAEGILLERIETVTMPAGKASNDPNKVRFKFIFTRNGRLSTPNHFMETYSHTFDLRCGISGTCVGEDMYSNLNGLSSSPADPTAWEEAVVLCDSDPSPYLLERVESVTHPSGKGAWHPNKIRLQFIFTTKGRLSTPNHHMETYVRQIDIRCGIGGTCVQADFFDLLDSLQNNPDDPSLWDDADDVFVPCVES